MPTKTIKLEYLEFGDKEKELYSQLVEYSKQKLSRLKLAGKADYIHVFALLLKMRQACDHTSLLKNRGSCVTDSEVTDLDTILHGKRPEFASKVSNEVLNPSETECPVSFLFILGLPRVFRA